MKNRINELRKERKLTLRELAGFIGINYSTIACYETDKREPNIEMLKKLASFFEVSLDYLCGYDKYIYCLYENANYSLSLTNSNFVKLKDYIYYNQDNKRCININKYLNLKDDANIIEFINELYSFSQFDMLFNEKSVSIDKINSIKDQDIILSVELLNKIKDLIK